MMQTFLLGLLVMLPAGDVESIWSEANEAYKAGSYEKSVALYESLIEEGVETGKLHFNLGNAYFKTNELGRAILHYHKARRFLPGDEDLEANLRLADERRADPKIDEESEAMGRSLVILANSIEYRLIFFMALFFICCAGLASIALVLRPGLGKWPGYVLVIAATAGLLLTGAAFLQYRELERNDQAIIISEAVNVLSGPSIRESISFTIHEGIQCQILDSVEGWYRIRLANGYNGWVPQRSLETI